MPEPTRPDAAELLAQLIGERFGPAGTLADERHRRPRPLQRTPGPDTDDEQTKAWRRVVLTHALRPDDHLDDAGGRAA